MQAKAQAANALLESGKGAGSDFLGWVHLPSSITPDRIEAIEKQAAKLREKAEVIICIGIGGSYLGAKAVLEAMSDSFKFLHKKRTEPVVVFAGQNISEDYTHELLEAVKEYSIATIVISKSGTTTEPAIAFRLIKAEIEKRYGKQEAAERIVAITDKARGALKTLADNEGYPTFVIPDDVGGRFSVLTPVGLLPLAAAGVDIAALVRGAQEMERATADGTPFEKNPAAVYAAVRNELYEGGKKIEILGSYEPKLQYINEWWKQLYGESEGKDGKGIFPASVTLTADLHSMGQYIQDGERTLFETIISVAGPASQGNAFRRSTAWPSWACSWPTWTAASRTSASRFRRSTRMPSARCSTSSSAPAASAATSSASIRSTSPAWRRTRRICSPCWTNPATKRLRKPSRHGCNART